MATLEQLSAFEVLLDEVYVDCRPKPSDYDVRRDLLRIFNEIAKEIYGYSADAPVIEVFGHSQWIYSVLKVTWIYLSTSPTEKLTLHGRRRFEL